MLVTKQNNYEIMYIADDEKPELNAALKKEFLEILTADGGKLNKEEEFVRPFAYKINNKLKGQYYVFEILTSATNINNFNRVFSIKQKQGEVIRKLIINLDEEKHNTFKKIPEKKPVFNQDSRFRKPGFVPNRDFRRDGAKPAEVKSEVKVEVKPEVKQEEQNK